MHDNFSILFAAITICSLIACAIPLLLKWSICPDGTDPRTLPIYSAVKSNEYYVSLITTVGVSIPFLIDFFCRIFLSPNFLKLEYVNQNIYPVASAIFSLTALDLFSLLYIIPNVDLTALNYVIKVKIIMTTSSALYSIYKYGKSQWSSYGLLLCLFCFCLSRFIIVMRVHWVQSIYQMMVIITTMLDLFAYLIYFLMANKWFQFIYHELKTKTITKDQYLCTVYTVVYALLISACVLIQYTHYTNIEWYYSTVINLITYFSVLCCYYVLILIFEGKAIQREVLLTQVRLSILLLIL